MSDQVHLFMMGGGCGLFFAVVGAFTEYFLTRRHERKGHEDQFLPSCLMLSAGVLGLFGLVVIGISFLLTGSIWPAIIFGGGVIFGFFFGFAVLFVAVFLLSSRSVDFLE